VEDHLSELYVQGYSPPKPWVWERAQIDLVCALTCIADFCWEARCRRDARAALAHPLFQKLLDPNNDWSDLCFEPPPPAAKPELVASEGELVKAKERKP
jgi:hypothetical protein